MILSIALVAAIGFALSLYGYFVERKIMENPAYKPACDLSDRISCSKPILSEYGKLFFVSNTLVGMAFYGLVFVLALLGLAYPIFLLSCVSLGATLVLAYILYFKVGSFCLICHAIYLVNIVLFVLSLKYR
jgi:vitamin-K-epoxide reductase (warfarin-sensitive)